MQSVKQFMVWIGLKQRLHEAMHKPPLVSERDMWWASLGENIGSEINGKSARFSRPVLILRKLSHSFYLVAPTTTQPREGSWYVRVHLSGQDEYVCLHQIRTIDHRRLLSKIGQLDTDDFKHTKDAFRKLYVGE